MPDAPLAHVLRDAPGLARGALPRPSDFNGAAMLLNTEVAIILKQMVAQRRSEGAVTNDEHMKMVLDHASRFDLMRGDQVHVQEVRNTALTHEFQELDDYEFIQIVNLGCDDVDEVKALIPSLKKKIDHPSADSLLDDDRLRSIIYQISSYRKLDDGAEL